MKRQLRALQIIGDSKFGGDSVIICDWLNMLQERGISTTLLATDPPVVDLAKERGIEVWPFEGIYRSINPLTDIPSIFRLAKNLRNRFDVIHTNTSKNDAIGRPAARMAGIPATLHTVHGFAFHEFSGALTTKAFSSIEWMLGKMCDRVVFVNSYDREQAVEMKIIPKNKAVTVYNGVSAERLSPGLSTNREDLLHELNLNSNTFLSVFVGRLAEQKGLKYLFEVLSLIKKTILDFDIH